MEDNKKILDRLKQEGDLLRNSGTNSIKSLKKDFEKFNAVFESIETSINAQTEMLKAFIDLQTDIIKQNQTEDRFNKVADKPTSNSPQRGSDRSPTADVPPPRGGILPTFDIEGLLRDAMGGGRSLFTLGGAARAGLFAFMAPIIGDFVGDFLEAAVKDAGFSEEVSKSIGDAGNTGAYAATIGAIFGKRMALIFGAAGAASTFSDELLDKMGLDPNNMQSILGMEFSNNQIAQGLLTTIGGGAMVALSSPTLWESVFSKMPVGATGQFAKLGAQLAGVVAGAMIVFGDTASDWLESQGMPKDVAKLTSNVGGSVMVGASLGSMFGPGGMLIGAAIGLVFGLGKTIYDWLSEKETEAQAAVRDAQDDINKQIEANGTVNQGEYTPAQPIVYDQIKQSDPDLIARADAGDADALAEVQKRSEEIKQNYTSDVALGEVMNKATSSIVQVTVGNETSYINGAKEAIDQLKELAEKDPNNQKYKDAMNEIARFIKNTRAYTDLGPDEPSIPQELKDVLEFAGKSYRYGTKGFVDFGKESMAVLHGKEAVVPQDSLAGMHLQKYFDTNMMPKVEAVSPYTASMEKLATTAQQTSPNITYAPVTHAPTTNVYQGGSTMNNSSTVVMSGTGMDLDRPGYAR